MWTCERNLHLMPQQKRDDLSTGTVAENVHAAEEVEPSAKALDHEMHA
jgi:hypothetical protein